MFLDFISYSGGPLPEELLAVIKVPVTIGWGDQDPWEPIEQGREFASFDIVEVGDVTTRVFWLHLCLFLPLDNMNVFGVAV